LPSAPASCCAGWPPSVHAPDPLSVSIIIPSYNNLRHLPRAVESARSQTYPDREIIVVDDGSTDGTVAWLRDNGGDLRWAEQPNGGPGAARNTGLGMADGKYVQFLDADDTIHPEKLARNVPLLESREDVSLVFSDCINIDCAGVDYGERPPPLRPDESALSRLIVENFLQLNSALIRSAAIAEIGGFDDCRTAQEDWDLWLRLALRGHRFHYQPGVLAYYHHDGSVITTDAALMYQRGVHFLTKHSAGEMRKLAPERLREFVARRHQELATRAYNQGWWHAATRHVLAAVWARPQLLFTRFAPLGPKALVHWAVDGARRKAPGGVPTA
jgi:glycosyltransferase involved in cell wall biosynthesis